MDSTTVIVHLPLIPLSCGETKECCSMTDPFMHVEAQGADQEELCLILMPEFFVMRLWLYNRVSYDRV